MVHSSGLDTGGGGTPDQTDGSWREPGSWLRPTQHPYGLLDGDMVRALMKRPQLRSQDWMGRVGQA